MQQSPPSCPIIAVLHKEVDSNVNSKLIYLIQEKIEDTLLVAFMQKMFDAKVIKLVFGGYYDSAHRIACISFLSSQNLGKR